MNKVIPISIVNIRIIIKINRKFSFRSLKFSFINIIIEKIKQFFEWRTEES